MFGVPLTSVLITLAASVVGFAAHVLMKVADLRETDKSVTLTSYFSRVPYRTTAKLLTVLISVVALAEPNITPLVVVGAAGIGYTADSAANRLGK